MFSATRIDYALSKDVPTVQPLAPKQQELV